MISNKLKEFAWLEIRLLSRNSRIKTILSSGIIIFPLFVIFSFDSLVVLMNSYIYFGPLLYVFFSFVSSIFSVTIGVHTMNWESSYSNLIFTLPITKNEFFVIRFLTLIILNLFGTIYFTAFLLFLNLNYPVILLAVSSFFINSGVGAIIVLWSAKFNKLYIDLYRTSFLNYEISTINSFITPLLINIIIYCVYLGLFALINNIDYVLIAMGVTGCIGLIFSLRNLKLIEREVGSSKYRFIKAFEEQNN